MSVDVRLIYFYVKQKISEDLSLLVKKNILIDSA